MRPRPGSARWLVSLGLLCLAGCQPSALGGVETTIHVHSLVGVAGTEARVASGCLWLIGGTGSTRLFTLLSTHGNATVPECMALPLLRVPLDVSPAPPGP